MQSCEFKTFAEVFVEANTLMEFRGDDFSNSIKVGKKWTL